MSATGRRFELRYLEPTDEHPDGAWHAQTHCDCGSTFTSGEPWPTPTDATHEADHGLRDHLAQRVTPRCGIAGHRAILCACAQCKEHSAELARLVKP